MSTYFTFAIVALFLLCDYSLTRISYLSSNAECDRTFLASRSTWFSSPNFPFNYTKKLTCRFSFFVDEKVTISSHLCFLFTKFHLKQTDGCSDDWLDFEGMGKFCGDGWMDGDKTSNVSIFQPFCVPLNGRNKYIVTFRSADYSSDLGFYSVLEISEMPKPSITPICPLASSLPCLTTPQKCISKEELCGQKPLCEDASDVSQDHAKCFGEDKVKFRISSIEDALTPFTSISWFREQAIVVPPYDHTTLSQEGHIMKSTGETSILQLEIAVYPSIPNKCLSFWYFTHGKIDSFLVKVKTSGTSGLGTMVWMTREDFGYGWKLGEIQLSGNWGSAISVAFESKQEAGASVSIDDIFLMPGLCSGEDISCSFELNSCAWDFLGGFTLSETMLSFIHPHDLQPNRNKAAVTILRDHSRALMMSRPVTLRSPVACLMLSYRVASKSPDKSSILISGKKYDGTVLKLKSLVTSTGYSWEIATVVFETFQFEGNVRIQIEAIAEEFKGAIVIDNITFTPGLCPKLMKSTPSPLLHHYFTGTVSPRPTTRLTTTKKGYDCQFKCGFGTACIDQTLVCNGFKDCVDASDEVDCPKTGGPLKYFDSTLQPSFLVAITVAVTVLVVSTVAVMFFVVTRKWIRRRHRVPGYLQSGWDQADSPSDHPKPPPYSLHPPPYSHQAPPYSSTEQINLKDFDSPPPAFPIQEIQI